MPNTELLKKTLAHIETHQDQWSQNNWITPAEYRDNPECGTAYCFAGWSVALSGYRITKEGHVPVSQLPPKVLFAIDEDEIWEDYDKETDRDVLMASIADVATLLLGVPPWGGPFRRNHLFGAHNTLNDLRRHVAELCGETTSDGD